MTLVASRKDDCGGGLCFVCCLLGESYIDKSGKLMSENQTCLLDEMPAFS